MTKKKHHEGLPKVQDQYMVSVLFFITSPKVTVRENHIEFPNNAHVVVFSDRPHRIAKVVPGGVAGFAKNIFLQSDFTTDKPNVTFAGNLDADQNEYYTVIELGNPTVHETSVVFPVVRAIGDESLVPPGVYSNASLVVDNFWTGLCKGLEIGGGILGTIAAGIATVGACTVGEVATGGADTALCVAGISGTIGAGSATVGVIGGVAANGV